jgi:Uma2 family endonuclease
MATVDQLLTVEEYAQMPDDGRRTELVRGRIIELPPPNYLHGLTCVAVVIAMGHWLAQRKLGRIVSNDSGIVTKRNPDILRGADVAYYSYARIALGANPGQYPDVPPEIVIEVRSPSDRWKDIHEKVAEYLAVGVSIVCVIDPELRKAWLYFPDQPDRIVEPDEDLTFPECLADFSVPMSSLFESA